MYSYIYTYICVYIGHSYTQYVHGCYPKPFQVLYCTVCTVCTACSMCTQKQSEKVNYFDSYQHFDGVTRKTKSGGSKHLQLF
jgi:hypothetical protein